MLGQIPIAKFEQVKSQGLLTNRLIHQCLDRALHSLKQCGQKAQKMLDPNGNVRLVRTFLGAYIADLPEQQALSCVTTNHAPSSLAGPLELGDSHAHPLRDRLHTLEDIEELEKEITAWSSRGDLGKLKRIAKTYGLNGICEPFWCDWPHADPSLFLAPDALHQWHKLFIDHPVEWAKAWLGNEELDRRFSVLQPRIGFRHFRNGFTRYKQHTGKESKDIQRVYLAVIAGHANVTEGILKALRGLLDFIYLVQYESHSTATLQYLEDALQKFHRFKSFIANSGVRSGMQRNNKFNIPKIELLHHVKWMVKLLGSSPQFSSEQTERCHIELAKRPYGATNRKDYTKQMCRYLDRQERIRLFTMLTEWNSDNGKICPKGSPEWAMARGKAFECLIGSFLPAPVCDVFKAKASLSTDTTAFHLRLRPNAMEMSVQKVQSVHGLQNFHDDLCRYFLGARARTNDSLPFESLSIWWQVRVQLRDPQDPEHVIPPLTLQASPLSKTGKTTVVGQYNFVLLQIETLGVLESLNDFGIHGRTVAQVRVIFIPDYLDPSKARIPLAYVQPFKFASDTRSRTDAGTNMYRLKRDLRHDKTRKGLVVPLTRIWRPVELIPVFGQRCNVEWTCDTAVEESPEFYLNSFPDKATYAMVY